MSFTCTRRFGLSGALSWRSLDDEWVAYSAVSGAMSALDAFSAAVLDSVERGAQTADAVAASLVRDGELCEDPTIPSLVARVLDQLAAANLLNELTE
jgi:PqqD family protein of HPr-rel-A system